VQAPDDGLGHLFGGGGSAEVAGPGAGGEDDFEGARTLLPFSGWPAWSSMRAAQIAPAGVGVTNPARSRGRALNREGNVPFGLRFADGANTLPTNGTIGYDEQVSHLGLDLDERYVKGFA
jgi:hypothetical protein